MALANGPVGCGAFSQTARLNLPGFLQGIESFTALHACTDLNAEDLESGSDRKLEAALDEIHALFPLAKGVAILNQSAISLTDDNAKGIAKAKMKQLGKLTVSLPCGDAPTHLAEIAASFKAVVRHKVPSRNTPHDVAISFHKRAGGLVWIVSKLLSDIGLNPVLKFTGSSTSDIARIRQCKLAIGFSDRLDVSESDLLGRPQQRIADWFGIPLTWACFLSPFTTDASLRAIAGHFDDQIQNRAEKIIEENRKKTDEIVLRFRPHLQNKLILDFSSMPETQQQSYHLLGMRIGTPDGWPGKTGVWRTPRLACNRDDPSDKAIESYLAEAKPSLIIRRARNEHDWNKYGLAQLPLSPLLDSSGNAFWGYDGFACLAAALDRAVNAPWRKLLKRRWPQESG